jgi:hypothetical protein
MIHEAEQAIKAREAAAEEKKKTDIVRNAMDDRGLNPNIASDVAEYAKQIVANQDLQSMQNLGVPSNVIVPDPVAQHNSSEVSDLSESFQTSLVFDQSPPDEGKYDDNEGPVVASIPVEVGSPSPALLQPPVTPLTQPPVTTPLAATPAQSTPSSNLGRMLQQALAESPFPEKASEMSFTPMIARTPQPPSTIEELRKRFTPENPRVQLSKYMSPNTLITEFKEMNEKTQSMLVATRASQPSTSASSRPLTPLQQVRAAAQAQQDRAAKRDKTEPMYGTIFENKSQRLSTISERRPGLRDQPNKQPADQPKKQPAKKPMKF